MVESNSVEQWLESFIVRNGGVSGTVHTRAPGEDLVIAAAHNIPQKVIEAVRRIPKGKGMAGLAWERDQPVSTCNLQTDSTGDVRPGAKAVNAQAAVALPVHDESGALRAVAGIAFMGEKELSDEQLAVLQAEAEQLPR